ncbi:ABC transporter permease subunit [Bordetella avium]|nr:ABC transporter permease subunit [Bordetella avium]RIQ53519.1 ABC transporter permease subunit [Bordetella avium]RIQ61835.1 ABC transporter permease subunit [Bordetella avium]RIQ64577.1 ABC transporter permease subunit [Bordetella avium]RIQ77951.1 ABC transporter permease subunit [Bordetella avium]
MMDTSTTMKNHSTMVPAGRLSQALRAATPSIMLVVLILAVWEVCVWVLDVSAFVLPAPSSIFAVLLERQAELMQASLVTGAEILYGFVYSCIVGIAVALLVDRFAWFGRASYPLIVLFQNVPKIALAPLLILWFGYDLLPKVALIVIRAFFPVTLNMLVGLRAADANLVSLLQSIGATPNQVLARVKIPASLPALMAGMKVAITLSVIGAIVGEFVGASAGLGYMIQFASSQMDTALVFAALVQVSVLGVVFYYIIELLEARFLAWAVH